MSSLGWRSGSIWTTYSLGMRWLCYRDSTSAMLDIKLKQGQQDAWNWGHGRRRLRLLRRMCTSYCWVRIGPALKFRQISRIKNFEKTQVRGQCERRRSSESPVWAQVVMLASGEEGAGLSKRKNSYVQLIGRSMTDSKWRKHFSPHFPEPIVKQHHMGIWEILWRYHRILHCRQTTARTRGASFRFRVEGFPDGREYARISKTRLRGNCLLRPSTHDGR